MQREGAFFHRFDDNIDAFRLGFSARIPGGGPLLVRRDEVIRPRGAQERRHYSDLIDDDRLCGHILQANIGLVFSRKEKCERLIPKHSVVYEECRRRQAAEAANELHQLNNRVEHFAPRLFAQP